MEVAVQDAEHILASLVVSVQQGEEVVITQDGQPVARLVPMHDHAQSEEEIIASLSPLARKIWQKRVKLEGITVAELLEESRRDRR